jgi:Nif-specific regulatory protein
LNALAKIDIASSPLETGRLNRALAVFDEIVSILAVSGATRPALRQVMGLLDSRFGLRDGRLASIDAEGLLVVLAGPGADAPAQKPALKWRKILAAGAAAVVARKCKTVTLAAPILAEGEAIGLLAAEADKAEAQDENLLLLGLVANLIGPTLDIARRAPDAGAATPLPETPDPRQIIGESAALKGALDQTRRVAGTDLTILLRGESGAGKELFAQAIHNSSSRRGKPFIKVNCAALPETLLESELFGHERGAFTGAAARRNGRFELADGGTLLLDEIGEIAPGFQAKLLRVLQEGEFERVGGSKTLKVDVRVIAATHCDLEAAVQKKSFRADLYYRLGVAAIQIPSLRDRREDIPLLAKHVLARFNAENRRAMTLHPGAVELICKCAFPGNVRELENCVRAAATMARGAEIVERDFACRNRSCFSARLRQARLAQHVVRRPPLAKAI